jgi:probable DNA metabolism protein
MGEIFLYDGSFAGLLTVLALVVPQRLLPETISTVLSPQQELFGVTTTVATDEAVAESFHAELTRLLTPRSLKLIYRTFLADHPEKELIICRFCLLAWQEGKRTGALLAHPDVAPLWKLAQQVGREAHRLLGFVRFQEVSGGFYYAPIAAEHRILTLIAPHFAARFRDQQWVIYDQRHEEGIIHDSLRHRWLLLPMAAHAEPDRTPAEEEFQRLWREYFATLTISERENRKLQQGKVPLKQRPWLTEFAVK